MHSQPTIQNQQAQTINALHQTVGHFFPQLHSWIAALHDPRMKGKITYPLPVLLWMAILIFLLKMEARRQITWILRPDAAAVLSHLAALTGIDLSELSSIACDDTVDNLLSRVSVVELQRIPQNMVHRLIRNRVLEHGRLLDTWYMVAIDATGLFSRRQRHCPRCLVKPTSSGDPLYYHAVLEAKLVTRDGLALSIGSEPIENDGGYGMDRGGERYKQDCELNAFKRLAPRIKDMFPLLRICLLCDSLYAAATVTAIINDAGRQRWKIENQGFNTQKNGGYNLEHVYSYNENAAKCFYICLQIAHIINQLIEHGSLIEHAVKKYGSIKNLTRCLVEAIRFIVVSPAEIKALFEKPFQIRLNSS